MQGDDEKGEPEGIWLDLHERFVWVSTLFCVN
jgi:hypothetical protein